MNIIQDSAIQDIISKERTIAVKWLKNALEIEASPKSFYAPIGMNSIIKVVNDKHCSGCGACSNLCPHKAIKMEHNSEGFWIPNIDYAKCTSCGLCLKKCPSMNPNYRNNPEPKCMAMMATDDIRKVSSSGGMFTVAAEYILDKGGVICGAAYSTDFSVKHIMIDSKDDLDKLRGSKYIQSKVDEIYPEIKKCLLDDRYVLFTGMPCQVAGLYSFLGKDYDKLFTIDLLCHGITSSKVFEKYHKDVLGGKDLNRLEFKEKEPWGWHAGINAYFCDGTKYSEPLEKDPYFIAYLHSLSKNTICSSCSSNRLPRQGDMTIGDFWGIARKDPEMFDNKGTSVVLLNNDKGEKIFDRLVTNMKSSKQESLSGAIEGNRIIKAPYGLHKNRNVFFEYLDEFDFESLTIGCDKGKFGKIIYESIKKRDIDNFYELFCLAKTVAEHANGRKIVTWIYSKQFEKILYNEFGLSVAFYIAQTESRVNNVTVYPFSKIAGEKDKYYVVALDASDSEKVVDDMKKCGYSEVDDYISYFRKPIVLTNYDLSSGLYMDEYGNTIEGNTGIISKIIFRGGNNHISIGKNITGLSNLSFDLSANSNIEIGDNNRFNAGNRFMIHERTGDSEIIIGENCRFTDALFKVFNSINTSGIYIGNACTFETNLELHANSGKKIRIGNDCMFSHEIDLFAGDGHTIFNVEDDSNINSLYDTEKMVRNEIIIKNHVWICKGAFIMHGTHIGSGSVVGAKSVVKGVFPNNCTIAGNPALMVKKNTAWSREMITTDITKCGKPEYYKLTDAEEYILSEKDIEHKGNDKKKELF